MFKGVLYVQDVQDEYTLYQLISNGHNLICVQDVQDVQDLFLLIQFIKTDTQNSANI